jgi:uncharacterized protein (TIGR02145 family)
MKTIKSIAIIIALIVNSVAFSQDPIPGDPGSDPGYLDALVDNGPPTNLTALNITQTTAILSWTDPNPNYILTTWEIYVYPSNGSPSFSDFGTYVDLPYTITGLIPGTAYSFNVRINNSLGSPSSWVGPYYFTTLSPIVQLSSIQNLCTKTTQPYNVNVGDALHDASTYVWSILPATPSAIITGNGSNAITIDWTNVPDGVYTLQAIETNATGCSSTAVSATINLLPTPAPVSPAQTFCTSATVANLTATGTNLQWYAAETEGTALATTTPLATGIYYVSQTIGTCESPRTAVTVTVTPQTIPTFTQVASTCSGTSLTALPTTATNGISGTWSPALNNTITTTYTFTPTAVQCATTSTQTITISNPLTTSPISFVAAPLTSVSIGTQIWKNKNLDVTTYRDGTPIPQVTDGWEYLTTGAWCYYDNDPANGAVYGKLYNWYAIAGIYDAASLANPALRKKLAPSGWHVPSDTEWSSSINFIDPNADGGTTFPNIAGGKMKEIGMAGWSSNEDAINNSGFRALPQGTRDMAGRFSGIGGFAQWWSISELDFDNNSAWFIQLWYWDARATKSYYGKTCGFAVRLIKD